LKFQFDTLSHPPPQPPFYMTDDEQKKKPTTYLICGWGSYWALFFLQKPLGVLFFPKLPIGLVFSQWCLTEGRFSYEDQWLSVMCHAASWSVQPSGINPIFQCHTIKDWQAVNGNKIYHQQACSKGWFF
jgi:hypothetical protein